MFKRQLTNEFLSLLESYPVVTIIGPRQSGKTTLVKNALPSKAYVNLEAPDIREFALADPRAFLEGYPEGAILDEIQRAPILLSYIQTIVDENPIKGFFVLTGSHQLELHQAISQSLAGRTALLTLLPMSLYEFNCAGIDLTANEAMIKGGYPRIFSDHLDPTKAYRNYIQTYLERDLRQLIQIKDLMQFQRFLKLCAGRIGQILNLESLANDLGVSSATVKHWLSILEASFIVFRLQPHFENFGKRVVKASKLFFADVGLASYLLGIENEAQLERDPLRGNLFENLVYLELLKYRLNEGLDPNLYYFRDAHGHEVDFIYQSGNFLYPIEVKSGKTFNSDFLKNLKFFAGLAPERTPKRYIIYGGAQEQKIGETQVLNFENTYKIVSSLDLS